VSAELLIDAIYFCNFSERHSVARDEAGSARLADLDAQITSLTKQVEEMRGRWELEREGVNRLQDLKNKIDATLTQIAKAEREFNLNKAAELKFELLPSLKEQLKKEEELYAKSEASKMVHDTVTDDSIAAIVATWTGVPVSKLLETEVKKLLRLEDELSNTVIGQPNATKAVAEVIQRSRAGLSDPSKPTANLVFLGPTGVGKTELSKALAKFLFDSEDAMVRVIKFSQCLLSFCAVVGPN
jgi:ATP-dependent Clp protease ATP-binding subunit ClpB